MLVLVFGLMAGPFILNGSITLNMLRKTQASRTLPDRVMAGSSSPSTSRSRTRND